MFDDYYIDAESFNFAESEVPVNWEEIMYYLNDLIDIFIDKLNEDDYENDHDMELEIRQYSDEIFVAFFNDELPEDEDKPTAIYVSEYFIRKDKFGKKCPSNWEDICEGLNTLIEFKAHEKARYIHSSKDIEEIVGEIWSKWLCGEYNNYIENLDGNTTVWIDEPSYDDE